MKTARWIVAFLLLAHEVRCGGHSGGTRPNTFTVGECKAICKDIREEVLANYSVCKPALVASPVPQLFQTCVAGRKKAFDKACVPLCSSAETLEKNIDSFEGCRSVVKKGHGPSFVDWCRKGYDNVFTTIKPILAEQNVTRHMNNQEQQIEYVHYTDPETEKADKLYDIQALENDVEIFIHDVEHEIEGDTAELSGMFVDTSNDYLEQHRLESETSQEGTEKSFSGHDDAYYHEFEPEF